MPPEFVKDKSTGKYHLSGGSLRAIRDLGVFNTLLTKIQIGAINSEWSHRDPKERERLIDQVDKNVKDFDRQLAVPPYQLE